jgi:hypothetical protein
VRGIDDADSRCRPQGLVALDAVDEAAVRPVEDDQVNRFANAVAELLEERMQHAQHVVVPERGDPELREQRTGPVGARLRILRDDLVGVHRREEAMRRGSGDRELRRRLGDPNGRPVAQEAKQAKRVLDRSDRIRGRALLTTRRRHPARTLPGGGAASTPSDRPTNVVRPR